MKHPFFKFMGTSYPIHLEREYERILIKIEALWDTSQIHDYFSDLLIDKRGGRKGFPADVLADIIRLRDERELQTFKQAEGREQAMRELTARGIAFLPKNFFQQGCRSYPFIIRHLPLPVGIRAFRRGVHRKRKPAIAWS